MKILILLIPLMFSFCRCGKEPREQMTSPVVTAPGRLPVGYSVPIQDCVAGKLRYAKSVGIEYVEVAGMKHFVDEHRTFIMSDKDIVETLIRAKKAADDAGIKIWSVHMPYGPNIDLSIPEERERQEVVALHKKLLGFLEILRPQIILFHPSYYLGLNERDLRKRQMIKSARELNEAVQRMKASMVIENMLGPELLRDENRERPLCRTVEETVDIMNQLPASIYSAIDMNHIANPEHLIRAVGGRLKSVHIADGTGKAEDHYFPCAGEGRNNWTEILSALYEVGYSGPFLFECAYEDETELVSCYNTLHSRFIAGQQGRNLSDE